MRRRWNRSARTRRKYPLHGLGEVASKLANAGLNIQAIYVIGLEGELVEVALAVDDFKKAKKVLE